MEMAFSILLMNLLIKNIINNIQRNYFIRHLIDLENINKKFILDSKKNEK